MTRGTVYLRETIALTRSSELQEMYAAFIVAVAKLLDREFEEIGAKLLEIAASNSDKSVIDVYTSVSACFEIFANEIHEAEKREKEMKRKKRQTPSTMKESCRDCVFQNEFKGAGCVSAERVRNRSFLRDTSS